MNVFECFEGYFSGSIGVLFDEFFNNLVVSESQTSLIESPWLIYKGGEEMFSDSYIIIPCKVAKTFKPFSEEFLIWLSYSWKTEFVSIIVHFFVFFDVKFVVYDDIMLFAKGFEHGWDIV